MILKRKNRKSQITVFIIIGLIMLFTVAIYGYMKSAGVSTDSFFQPDSPPVVKFVDACLEKTAEDALREMGDQGGYIRVPLSVSLNPTRHVSLIPGVGGEFVPKVPFWYYEGKSYIPGINYIEHEIETYINDNLRFCLNNFTHLRDEYDITEDGNYAADVVLAEKEVVIALDYKINIHPKGGGEDIKVDQFLVKLDVPIKKMWELAKEILEAENQMTFFENLTINIMGSHPPEDIPFTGLELDCNKRQWLLSDIKRKLIQALEPSILAVRFKNTNHAPFEGKEDEYKAIDNAVTTWRESRVRKPLILPKKIPSDSFDYFQHYFRFTDKDYKGLNVLATFKKEWGMNLIATPNQYGVLKSGVQDLKSQILSYLCLNTYHFVYDVNYPLMISISDPEALHGEGYVFRFAFPVQIFHNYPKRSLLPTQIIEPTEYTPDFCGQKAGQEHTIIARDIITNAELSKVNLSFKCVNIDCDLGVTRTNNRHLQWSGKFPEACLGPIIIANRSGYLITEKQHDTTEPFYIDMFPTQKVKFEVKRHTSTAPETPRFLEQDMYAVIQVQLNNPPLNVFDIYGGRDIFNRSIEFDLVRADATYIVNIILMKKVNNDDDEVIGGWMGNWSVKLEDMLDAKKIVFHVPQRYPSPKNDLEMVEMYEMMNNRSMFPNLVPEIIRADEASSRED